MKLIFMGTPSFAATALAAIKHAGFDIVAAYTRPPTKAGRGMKPTPSPVQERAESDALPVHMPTTLKDDETLQQFAAYQADIAVVAAYGMVLPPAYLEAPRLGCWNIHASLLPRWRGAAPIQRAIMAGDTETGVSIMHMDAGLDTGDVLLTRPCAIVDNDTAQSLHDKLARLGGEAIITALADAENLRGLKQSSKGVTYAKKIDKAETRIDWSQPAPHVHNHIRGLSPFPGAWTQIDGARVKILAAELAAGSGAPGTVLDDALTIACSKGAVRLTRLQKAGKAAMDARDFLRGAKLAKGCVLSCATD